MLRHEYLTIHQFIEVSTNKRCYDENPTYVEPYIMKTVEAADQQD
jgi:hypothetical protein